MLTCNLTENITIVDRFYYHQQEMDGKKKTFSKTATTTNYTLFMWHANDVHMYAAVNSIHICCRSHKQCLCIKYILNVGGHLAERAAATYNSVTAKPAEP